MSIKIRSQILYNGNPVNMAFPHYIWGGDIALDTHTILYEVFEIAANSSIIISNANNKLITNLNSILCIFEDTTGLDSLSVQVNGSADVLSIKPVLVLSENLTTLTLTNSSTTTKARVRLLRLVSNLD